VGAGAVSVLDLVRVKDELLGFRTGGLGESFESLAAGGDLAEAEVGALVFFLTEVGVFGGGRGASDDGSGEVATMLAGLWDTAAVPVPRRAREASETGCASCSCFVLVSGVGEMVERSLRSEGCMVPASSCTPDTCKHVISIHKGSFSNRIKLLTGLSGLSAAVSGLVVGLSSSLAS
jgi:hypothetical protein